MHTAQSDFLSFSLVLVYLVQGSAEVERVGPRRLGGSRSWFLILRWRHRFVWKEEVMVLQNGELSKHFDGRVTRVLDDSNSEEEVKTSLPSL